MLTTPDVEAGEIGHRWPEILPGGDAVLFTIARETEPLFQIAVVDMASGDYEALIAGSNPHYVATGHVVFGINGTLWAAPFDLKARAVTGSAIPVVQNIITKRSGAASFSVSRSGALAYLDGDSGTLALLNTAVWVDSDGNEEPLSMPAGPYVHPRVSPDGRLLALDGRATGDDIWLWDFARESVQPLTFNRAPDHHPVWTLNSQYVLFRSGRTGFRQGNVLRRAADGTGEAEELNTDDGRGGMTPSGVTPDGRFVLVRWADDLFTLALDPPFATSPLWATGAREQNPVVSPDGNWFAYQSDEFGGRDEVIVRPFPDAGAGQWRVSTDGGATPLWSGDGRLFYEAPEGRIMVVRVHTDGAFRPDPAEEWLRGPYQFSSGPYPGRAFDISPDGKRLLMLEPVDQAGDGPALVVVLNWLDELERLVPVD